MSITSKQLLAKLAILDFDGQNIVVKILKANKNYDDFAIKLIPYLNKIIYDKSEGTNLLCNLIIKFIEKEYDISRNKYIPNENVIPLTCIEACLYHSRLDILKKILESKNNIDMIIDNPSIYYNFVSYFQNNNIVYLKLLSQTILTKLLLKNNCSWLWYAINCLPCNEENCNFVKMFTCSTLSIDNDPLCYSLITKKFGWTNFLLDQYANNINNRMNQLDGCYLKHICINNLIDTKNHDTSLFNKIILKINFSQEELMKIIIIQNNTLLNKYF